MVELTWQDVYKLPLKINPYYDFQVQTADNTKAFNLVWSSKYGVLLRLEDKQKLVDIINGSSDRPSKLHTYSIDGGKILMDDHTLLVIRGWGYLIGAGGLGLNAEVAARIQDEFRDYIVKQLKQANVLSEYNK